MKTKRTMNENINLCEILKNCPKGEKFYSPLFGDAYFLKIDLNHNFPIVTTDEMENERSFMSDGRNRDCNAECLLLPSKDQRDWSKWKCPKPKFDPKTLQPFDKVLVRDKCTMWSCGIFTCLACDNRVITTAHWDFAVPYNDDTKHLVGTKKEAPAYYRYWDD